MQDKLNLIMDKGELDEYCRDAVELRLKGKLDQNFVALLNQAKLASIETRTELNKVMIEIKKQELLFSQKFDKTPSSQAKTAIKTGVNEEGFAAKEEKDLDEIIKIAWNRFVDTLKRNPKMEWVLTCKFCQTGLILPTKELAIERFKKHLLETHSEELVKIV